MSGMFNLADIFELVIHCFNHSSLSQSNFVHQFITVKQFKLTEEDKKAMTEVAQYLMGAALLK